MLLIKKNNNGHCKHEPLCQFNDVEFGYITGITPQHMSIYLVLSIRKSSKHANLIKGISKIDMYLK